MTYLTGRRRAAPSRGLDLVLKYIGWLIIAAAAILLFVPDVPEPVFVVAALLPWFVLGFAMAAIRSGRLSRHVSALFAYLIYLPMTLGFAALISDTNWFDWLALVLCALLLGAIYTAMLAVLFIRKDDSAPEQEGESTVGQRALTAGILMAIGLMIGFGFNIDLLAHLNATFPSPQPIVAKGVVYGKEMNSGRRPAYYLDIVGLRTSSGTDLGRREWTVDADLYRHAEMGTKVCVLLYTGLLRLRWYDVVDCSAARPRPALADRGRAGAQGRTG